MLKTYQKPAQLFIIIIFETVALSLSASRRFDIS